MEIICVVLAGLLSFAAYNLGADIRQAHIIKDCAEASHFISEHRLFECKEKKL